MKPPSRTVAIVDVPEKNGLSGDRVHVQPELKSPKATCPVIKRYFDPALAEKFTAARSPSLDVTTRAIGRST